MIYIIAIKVLLIGIFLISYLMKKYRSAQEKNERNEIIMAAQGENLIIATRPSATADDILERMRKGT